MTIIKRIWRIAKTEWQSIFREPPPVFDEESWQAKKARYQTKRGYQSRTDQYGSSQNRRQDWNSKQSSERQRQGGSSSYDQGSSSQASSRGPGDARERQYRANLEVDGDAGLKEIRKAYKALIRKYHPDLFHTEPEKRKVALEITTQLNEAMAYFEKNLR